MTGWQMERHKGRVDIRISFDADVALRRSVHVDDITEIPSAGDIIVDQGNYYEVVRRLWLVQRHEVVCVCTATESQVLHHG